MEGVHSKPIFEVSTTLPGSGDGGESNHPATNFPGISVDSNRFDRLLEKVGLGVKP